MRHASPETLGGQASRVQHAIVSCATHRSADELDVVVLDGNRVRLIGEAKFTSRPRTIADVERLEHCRDLLRARKGAKGLVRLAVFAGNGEFDPDLVELAGRRDDIVLVDLDRLYQGS